MKFRRVSGRLQCCEGRGSTLEDARRNLDEALAMGQWRRVQP